MLKFTQYVDMTDVNDSMELDSGTVICELETDDGYCVIEVRGEVSVDYKGSHYRYPSEFPDKLKELIHKDASYHVYAPSGEPNTENANLYIDMTNWFEAFWGKSREDEYDFETVDVEQTTSSRLLDVCLECIGFLKENDNEKCQ